MRNSRDVAASRKLARDHAITGVDFCDGVARITWLTRVMVEWPRMSGSAASLQTLQPVRAQTYRASSD